MLFTFVAEGRVASDPLHSTTESGTAKLYFRFLHSDSYYDRGTGGWRDRTPVGIDVTAWGKTATNARNLRKGDLVTISFRADLHTRITNEKAYLKATAETISFSARFDPATSGRQTKTPALAESGDAVRTAHGELIPA